MGKFVDAAAFVQPDLQRQAAFRHLGELVRSISSAATPRQLASEAVGLASAALAGSDVALVLPEAPGLPAGGASSDRSIDLEVANLQPGELHEVAVRQWGDRVLTAAVHIEAADVPGLLVVAPGAGVEREEAALFGVAVAEVVGEATDHLVQRQACAAVQQKAVALALESPERRREALSTLAHDLRSPLASLTIGCDMIARTVRRQNQPDLVEIVQYMRSSVQQFLLLADNIGTLNKLQQGTLALQRKSLDLVALVQSAVQQVEPAAQERQVRIDSDLPSDVRVRADEQHLALVVANLLHNALGFAPEGSRVLVTLDTGEGDARLHVTDDGPGVAAHERQSIFQPYFSSSARQGRRPGVGLGLAVARNLARQMDGDVTLASDDGQPTRFTVRLPLLAAASV